MKITLALFLLIISAAVCNAQLSLDVRISGIRNQTGKIMYQLFDENEKVVDQQIGEIKGDSCLFTSVNLKPGKYGLRYYHDENENMVMETGFRGIPKEGYGFSNNAKGSFGPPSFDKWLFELGKSTILRLRITY
ncbi:MAG: DUF2141 domain-containing protein [Bacteroidales bacterium]|jgi:uncharacterized protein (DUF2141 family)|nr:DUF2141 domain-containing protein [Bacteroidales bacterium]MCU0408020.1 DUF2141 domain-containing protein [Bacteroidales bacterium]